MFEFHSRIIEHPDQTIQMKADRYLTYMDSHDHWILIAAVCDPSNTTAARQSIPNRFSKEMCDQNVP